MWIQLAGGSRVAFVGFVGATCGGEPHDRRTQHGVEVIVARRHLFGEPAEIEMATECGDDRRALGPLSARL